MPATDQRADIAAPGDDHRANLAQLFEQSPSFMAFLSGPAHTLEFANSEYMKLIGHRPVIGKPVAEALAGSVVPEHLVLLDRVYATGEIFRADGALFVDHPQSGANARYVDVVYQPIRDANGAVNGIFVQGIEVTERMQDDLHRSTLERISAAIGDIRDPIELAWQASQIVGETLKASRVGYSRIEGENLVTVRDWRAPGVESLAGTLSLRDFGSYIDDLRRGKVNAIDDVRTHPRTTDAPALEARHARAFLNVPVLESGRLVAVFFVNMFDVHTWDDAQTAFIQEAAGRIRTATERLFADIARQRADDELRKLNAELEMRVTAIAAERDQFWRLSRDPFVICDMDGRWLSASPVWSEILGWDQDRLIGRTSAWMEHPDDHDKTRSKVIDVSRGEVMLNFTNRFRDTGGHFHTFAWTAVSENGRLFCVARDVTDADALTETLRLYEAIVRSDVNAICAYDTDLRVTAFNHALSDQCFRVYGKRPKVGMVFTDLFVSEQATAMRNFMSRALAGEAFTVTSEFGDPEIIVASWDITFNPVRTEDGRIVGAFHHAIDVSEHLRSQALLAGTEEALRQSQKMEAVGQLTGGLAHDFNNLLTAVTGGLELLGMRLAAGQYDKLNRYLNMAQTGAQRAAALTQRLLAFSRRQTLAPTPTDADRLIAGMTEMIDRTLGPAVDLHVIATAGLWPVMVDGPQLENALLNLCINARDAMPDGGRLTIETGNKALDERTAAMHDLPTGEYISVCVTDTGTGMSPEIVERVFDPFFTTKPIGEGTGLGLSMIYGFARQSGGQVRIYSELGHGTTMCIYLPRLVGIHDLAEANTAATTRHLAKSGQTILLVEDEVAIRELVTEVLGDAGYRVLTASNGPMGVALLQSSEQIDLLVTDVGLPGGLNGRQVADAGRAIRPALKVLFVTGYAANAAIGAGHLDEGMSVLTKPFNVMELERRVSEIICASG